MKKYLFLFSIAIVAISFISCGKKDPLSSGEWFGTIIRSSDKLPLSKVAFCFEGKSLEVYSNAIFGSTCFLFERVGEEENGAYHYAANDSIKLSIEMELRNDSLFIHGDDFEISATKNLALADKFKKKEYKHQPVPQKASSYLYGNWAGDLYRTSDNKLLSRIMLTSQGDSMIVFSNAIYGKENVISVRKKYNTEIQAFEYGSRSFDWLVYEKDNKAIIQGKDFYAILASVANLDKSFFKNKVVSINPNMYLAGNIYQGQVIPKGDYAVMSAVVHVFLEIKIIDDEKLSVRSWSRAANSQTSTLSLFIGQSLDQKIVEKIAHYSIKDNVLSIENDKFDIRDNGNSLYQEHKKAKVSLTKGTAISSSQHARKFQTKTCWNCGGEGNASYFDFAVQRRSYGKCTVCGGTGKITVYD